jgi:hypothetical protein
MGKVTSRAEQKQCRNLVAVHAFSSSRSTGLANQMDAHFPCIGGDAGQV